MKRHAFTGKSDLLLGHSGDREGLGGAADFGYAAVEGEAELELDGAAIHPALLLLHAADMDTKVKAKGSWSVGSYGAGFGGHIYYDRQERRFKIDVSGKLAVLVGFGFNVEYSLGLGGGPIKAYFPHDPYGGIPNQINDGDWDVLVGG